MPSLYQDAKTFVPCHSGLCTLQIPSRATSTLFVFSVANAESCTGFAGSEMS